MSCVKQFRWSGRLGGRGSMHVVHTPRDGLPVCLAMACDSTKPGPRLRMDSNSSLRRVAAEHRKRTSGFAHILPPYLVLPSSTADQRTREQLAESRLLINLLKHGSHTENLRLFNDFDSYLLQGAGLATSSRGGWYCQGAQKICDAHNGWSQQPR
jgi:hypothetical protein